MLDLGSVQAPKEPTGAGNELGWLKHSNVTFHFYFESHCAHITVLSPAG